MTGAARVTEPPAVVNALASEGVWCECTLSVPDFSRTWMFAGYHAPRPRLAMRWLVQTARRLADLIDPEPDAPWAAQGTLHPGEGVQDPAVALRMWPDALHEHQLAVSCMLEGSLYSFTAVGHDLAYGLSTRPLLVTASPYRSDLQAPAPCRGCPNRGSPAQGTAPGRGAGSTLPERSGGMGLGDRCNGRRGETSPAESRN